MNQLMEVCPDMYTHVIDICNLADREKYVKTQYFSNKIHRNVQIERN